MFLLIESECYIPPLTEILKAVFQRLTYQFLVISKTSLHLIVLPWCPKVHFLLLFLHHAGHFQSSHSSTIVFACPYLLMADLSLILQNGHIPSKEHVFILHFTVPYWYASCHSSFGSTLAQA